MVFLVCYRFSKYIINETFGLSSFREAFSNLSLFNNFDWSSYEPRNKKHGRYAPKYLKTNGSEKMQKWLNKPNYKKE